MSRVLVPFTLLSCLLEMQFLPEAPVQCCLVLPSVACNGASTDAVHIVRPYSS